MNYLISKKQLNVLKQIVPATQEAAELLDSLQKASKLAFEDINKRELTTFLNRFSRLPTAEDIPFVRSEDKGKVERFIETWNEDARKRLVSK